MDQLFEESDFDKPVNDYLNAENNSAIQLNNSYQRIDFLQNNEVNSLSSSMPPIDIDTTAVVQLHDPHQSPASVKNFDVAVKEEKCNAVPSKINEKHPLYDKYSNPPTEDWCRQACDILGLPFKQFLHRCIKGLNIARCIPKNSRWVEADGNCGYRTIALLICGDEECHEIVRHAIANYMISNINPEIENFQPGSREAAIRKRQVVTVGLVERLGTGQHYWFGTEDMGILAFMLDVNIICWVDAYKCWCWFSKSQFYNLDMHSFDEQKPTIFMRQVGVDHFVPVLELKCLDDHINQQMHVNQRQNDPLEASTKTITVDSSNPSADESVIVEATVKKTNEELRNMKHPVFDYEPPTRQWLFQTCNIHGIPFDHNIFLKAQPVDDVYYWRPDPDSTISTEMNGHCGFFSLSIIHTGSPNHHGRIRLLIAKHILANLNILKNQMFG
uniref:OTU domain-containing protein n=1 Tax=Panagrolaimus sp. ES5 TaxID=591445 RepID=A0AC34GB64_9BILA